MKQDIWAATQPPSLDDFDVAPPRSALLDAKVMMVDDEPLMTELIQTYLEDEGYANFVSTNDPCAALALLRRERPGVLLLDLMMPQLSGFELLEQIRADRELRFTPVIVLTASTGADSKLRALQLGATDFLAKPVDSSELVLRLRNTLAFQQYHERLLNFDLATGLPNQRPFDKGIDEMVGRRELVGGLVALFSITVPECRRLRETFGQGAADELAKVLARRLERLASQTGDDSPLATPPERAPRVARLGAEQFGVVFEGLSDSNAVEHMAKQVMLAMAEGVRIGAHDVVPSAACGIAVAPTDGQSVEILRKCADLAASHVGEQATVRYKFSSSELNARSIGRMTLGMQLRGAAQRGELRLHYQPKIDFRDQRIVGAEALVRWQHPDHGLMPPGLFIPLAEEIGQIVAIGEWVMERACQHGASWIRAGLPPLKISINVAKPQFVAGNLCQTLRQALFDSGLPPQQLVVELTESILMDDVQAGIDLMNQIRSLGVTLSIDDFGTGYSSLSYLTQFPIDELKIDRSFVINLPGRASDVAVARTVIDLGHRLGMHVTAEGVETEAQRDCLQALGCDQYQGFLFSRPLPVDRFVELLRRSSPAAAHS